MEQVSRYFEESKEKCIVVAGNKCVRRVLLLMAAPLGEKERAADTAASIKQ